MIELEMRAREEVMSKGPKSRAYYRLQATRKLAGKGNMEKDMKKRLADEAAARKGAEDDGKEEEEKKIDDGVCREGGRAFHPTDRQSTIRYQLDFTQPQ